MAFHFSLRSLLALFTTACFLVVGSAATGFSQTSTATLTGTIEDQTGAVLPNVTVKVTNTDWNTARFTRTNEAGNYVLPALEPGNYSIAADLPGFKTIVQDGIALQVNQTARINIRLAIGSIEEIVHVYGACPAGS